jgi:hypothetical protein
MAITINSIPGAYSSITDSLWFVVSSNNYNQTSFKYVFDLSVGGSRIATIKIFADSGNYGVLDVAPILRNYFSSGFNPSGSGLLQNANTNLHLDFSIAFGEEYSGTTFPNLTSGTYKAWAFQLDPYRSPLSAYANKFLTSRDRNNAKVVLGEKFFVTYFNADFASATATIQKYFENGSTDGSASTGATISTVESLLLDLSPGAINSYLGTTKIDDNTFAYTVTIGADTIKLYQTCNPRFTPVQLVFQNAWGGYDSFDFRLLSRKGKNFSRKGFDSVNYIRNGSNMDFKDSSNKFYGGQTNFATSINHSVKVVSDYLSVTDYNLGSEILGSNEIYYALNGNYYPITMKLDNWQEKNLSSDKIFNYELEFDLGKTTYSQFR